MITNDHDAWLVPEIWCMTDRQTDRQTARQTDRQTDRWADGLTDRIDPYGCIQTDRKSDI